MVLVSCIMFGFGLTGASLNPARSFGPALFTNGLANADFWLLYFVGPLVGAALAALAARSFSSGEMIVAPMPATAPASKAAPKKAASRRK